jgi:hypothetical protein
LGPFESKKRTCAEATKRSIHFGDLSIFACHTLPVASIGNICGVPVWRKDGEVPIPVANPIQATRTIEELENRYAEITRFTTVL